MKPAITTSENRSPMTATSPEVSSWFRASTSFVMRVTSTPTGLWSKNRSDIRCRCEKIALRMSNMTRWPSRFIT